MQRLCAFGAFAQHSGGAIWDCSVMFCRALLQRHIDLVFLPFESSDDKLMRLWSKLCRGKQTVYRAPGTHALYPPAIRTHAAPAAAICAVWVVA